MNLSVVQGLLGIVVFFFIAWLFSENRKKISWRIIFIGILLQFVLAVLLLKVSLFQDFFGLIQKMVLALEQAAQRGAGVVFGYLSYGAQPFAETYPGAAFILAFKSLPLILFISALSSLLFYWRVLPFIVRGFSWVLQKTMGIGGVLGMGAAANIFVGMVESPLLIQPYLHRLHRSELFVIMVTGMATIAGTVMVLYASILSSVMENAMGHILTASLISAPAAISIGLVMVPNDSDITTGEIMESSTAASSMDAIAQGTMTGLRLLGSVVAMIIVLVAFVALINSGLSLLPDFQGKPISLESILGLFMAPFTWLMGIPWKETMTAGSLMGLKTILNEFIAYLEMAKLPANALSAKSKIIMTYALCGFANPGSLGIMLGGLSAMAPERKADFLSLGFKSIVAGTLATAMTGSVIAVLL